MLFGVDFSHHNFCVLGTTAVGSGGCKQYSWSRATMKLLGSRSCNTVVVIVRHTTADAVANTIVVVPVGDSGGNVSADTGRHIKCIGVGIA